MSIAQRLTEVKEHLGEAVKRSGRSVGDVELLAVSKTYPAEVVAEVVEAGQKMLGENRVQEALEKQVLLPSGIAWHLIGPLQRNKVRKVVGQFACLQGIDSLKLASAVARVAGELNVEQSIFLQVKVGGEDSKSGFEPSDLLAQAEELADLKSLKVQGLMAIPPPVRNSEEARPYFAEVRELRDQLSSKSGLVLPQLSMGMSGDFEAAIAEGSTMVRIGSAIFGKRDRTP
ncbi:MAG: YggS family pyridoxal phosphate-dependent enzyme [Roseibacillus sp.]